MKHKGVLNYEILYINTYVCMESREMVPMILSAGQQRTQRHERQTFGYSGGRREWDDLTE